MIPMLLDSSGRDSWISIIFSGVIYIVWIPIVFIIYKNIKHEHIFSWLIRNFGKFIVYPLKFTVLLYLIAFGTVALKETLTELM